MSDSVEDDTEFGEVLIKGSDAYNLAQHLDFIGINLCHYPDDEHPNGRIDLDESEANEMQRNGWEDRLYAQFNKGEFRTILTDFSAEFGEKLVALKLDHFKEDRKSFDLRTPTGRQNAKEFFEWDPSFYDEYRGTSSFFDPYLDEYLDRMEEAYKSELAKNTDSLPPCLRDYFGEQLDS